jgi:hypothetical protein
LKILNFTTFSNIEKKVTIDNRAVHWGIKLFLLYFEEKKLCSGGFK